MLHDSDASALQRCNKQIRCFRQAHVTSDGSLLVPFDILFNQLKQLPLNNCFSWDSLQQSHLVSEFTKHLKRLKTIYEIS